MHAQFLDSIKWPNVLFSFLLNHSMVIWDALMTLVLQTYNTMEIKLKLRNEADPIKGNNYVWFFQSMRMNCPHMFESIKKSKR